MEPDRPPAPVWPPPAPDRPELWPRPPVTTEEPTLADAPIVPTPQGLEWPSALISYTQPRYSGLTSAADVASRQDLANRQADAALRRSSMEGLTLRTALQDAREALVGVPADVYAGASLADALLKNDRLRGLGVLAVAVGLLTLAAV